MAVLATLALLCSCSSDSSSDASCGAFSACGGSLDGTTWQVDDVCIEGDLVGKLNSQLSSLPAACRNVIQTAHVDGSGTINYASGVETANLDITAWYLAVYSQACISALVGGAAAATSAVCSSIQSGMNSSDSGVNANCAVALSDCSCNVTQKFATGTQTDGYTVKGSTLEYTSGNDPMSYCVQDTALQEHGTNSSLGLSVLMTAHRI